MANKNWIGGASNTAQVSKVLVSNTWGAADTLTTTLTAEDGSTTQTVQTTAGSATIATIVNNHVSDLNSSNQSLFSVITWSNDSDTHVKGTADTAGVPFYISGSETTTGNGTYGTTVANGIVTANSGPNDWNTVANFTDENENAATAIPVNRDDVKILPHPTDEDSAGNPISYDILYGLDQNGVDLKTFRVPQSFKGVIGDSINSYYLRIDCTDNAVTTGTTVINSSCPALWLQGTHTDITVAALSNTRHALELKGGTITDLRLLGPNTVGKVTVADGTVVTNLWAMGLSNADIKIGTAGTSVTAAEIDSGTIEFERPVTTMNVAGGIVSSFSGGTTTQTINNRGGYVYWNGTGNLTTLNNYNGTFDLDRNTAHGTTIAAATIWNGRIQNQSGLKNVTWSTNVVVFGGTVQSETASTQAES